MEELKLEMNKLGRGLYARWPTGLLFGASEALSYILSANDAEGSHNGSAAVLKTAGRKAMQVRVLSPPPFRSHTI